MDLTTIIVSTISALATGGGLGGIFMLKENRRTKKLDNDKTVAAEWKELYERSEAKVENQSNKIEGLFKTLEEERNLRSVAETELAVSRILECRKTSCVDRDPPFGSHLIKQAQ